MDASSHCPDCGGLLPKGSECEPCPVRGCSRCGRNAWGKLAGGKGLSSYAELVSTQNLLTQEAASRRYLEQPNERGKN